MQRKLQIKFNWSRNLTSLCTLTICLVIAILPVIVISALLVQEGTTLYKNVETGQLDIAGYLAEFKDLLPHSMQALLDRLGMGDPRGYATRSPRARCRAVSTATQAFSFGQGTFDFVVSVFIMLYLLYFFLRDGQELVRKIRTAFPLGEQQKRRLQLKFTRVVRATVKGNVVVAVTQGALGGFIFWVLDIPSALLWAVIMAFLSLLPAVGAGIVWAPVAIYFLLSGMIWQGVVLGLFGVPVIGLVDNVLRPIPCG